MERTGAKYEFRGLICTGCAVKFDSKTRNKKQKYCTQKCASQHNKNIGRWVKNNPTWNKGMVGYGAGHIVSESTRKKISEAVKGARRKDWKGNMVGYSSLHCWLDNNFDKPDKCEQCGGFNRRLEWANISGEYKRDRDDFIVLCVPCHHAFDNDKRGIRKEIFVNGNGVRYNYTNGKVEKVH